MEGRVGGCPILADERPEEEIWQKNLRFLLQVGRRPEAGSAWGRDQGDNCSRLQLQLPMAAKKLRQMTNSWRLPAEVTWKGKQK